MGFLGDVQTNPMVSIGIWLGGKNTMTKIQLMLRFVAQFAGNVLAFCLFGLWYSFRFPGEGPFSHILSVESICAAVITLCAAAAYQLSRDVRDQKRLEQKTQ